MIQPSKEKIDPKRVPDSPYLGLEHIEANSRRIIGQAKASDAASTKAVFRAGDVLYGKLRPYLNKVCRPTFDGVCSTDIIVFPQKPELDSRFLMYFLNRPDVVEATTHAMAGVNLPRIGFDTLGDLDFPLPPLAEQKRIADRIEALLKDVDAARERLARVPVMLKRFRQSILAAACAGCLTEDWRETQNGTETGNDVLKGIEEARRARGASFRIRDAANSLEVPDGPDVPDSWTVVTCERLCQPERALTYGVIKLGADVKDGVPTLRSSDVRHLQIEEHSIKRISGQIADQYARTYLKGGELVITVRGTLGGIAVVPPHMKGFNVSREVAVIPLEHLLVPEFLAYAIGSDFTRKWLGEVERGVAYTGINIEHLRVLPLPVPPRSEQIEIVRRVDRVMQFAKAAEIGVALAQSRVGRVTHALLASAFAGELVPTEAEVAAQDGRPFEAGEELLRRIRETPAPRKPRVIDIRIEDRLKLSDEVQMHTLSTESVAEAIGKMKKPEFTFLELRDKLTADYEPLKEIVFRLLDDPKSGLTQVFNSKAKTMHLHWRKT